MSYDPASLSVSTTKRVQIIDITRDVAECVRSGGIACGVCFVYVPHTTASVTINENADPDVKTDIIKGLEEIVPEDLDYDHAEGNSPAHIKSSILGNSAQIIVHNGQLVLGTWQGVYFCEFDGPRSRKVYVKIIEG
ncbi:MAG: secondary thiamine-phosphate synthase enzyme YjbQ [Candidatus Omnitrophota bacterium]|nr:secondary thiamine-phosphate synthase enzyme YjbQ [Candidatus Omnitrophota bacterium]